MILYSRGKRLSIPWWFWLCMFPVPMTPPQLERMFGEDE